MKDQFASPSSIPPEHVEPDYAVALYFWNAGKGKFGAWDLIEREGVKDLETAEELFADDSALEELDNGKYRKAVLIGSRADGEWSIEQAKEFIVKTAVEFL